jgi:hypothetical protein
MLQVIQVSPLARDSRILFSNASGAEFLTKPSPPQNSSLRAASLPLRARFAKNVYRRRQAELPTWAASQGILEAPAAENGRTTDPNTARASSKPKAAFLSDQQFATIRRSASAISAVISPCHVRPARRRAQPNASYTSGRSRPIWPPSHDRGWMFDLQDLGPRQDLKAKLVIRST